jgi:hypothetical protein
MNTSSVSYQPLNWLDWLAEAERRLIEVYRLSPERLIAEYRREREITRGYHGREVLELLQNAGDAAALTESRGRVCIILNQHGLTIGNTGRPFDQAGVQSLQTANLSPKRQRESSVIGDKGLGFRAILNWTDSPLISSGDLGLAFHPDYSAGILHRLESMSPEAGERVAAEREMTGGLIVPRLAFPQCVREWASHDWPDDESLRAIADACQKLRSEGFDTAVGMPFSSPEAFKEAEQQLEELRPEFLLLVDSIDQLEIQIHGLESRRWRCIPSGDRMTIEKGGAEHSTWNVIVHSGDIPTELLDREEQATGRFMVRIAIPDQPHVCSGVLFCYFPTEAQFPLPLLAHATVELDETRKHVNETRANRHILSVLAELIADAAESYCNSEGRDRWSGCRLVIPQGAWGREFERLGFPDALKGAAATKAIVPVIAGGHREPPSVKAGIGRDSKWWPVRVFPEVAAITSEEEQKLAKHLDVGGLDAAGLTGRLIKADALTLYERASAIAGLIQSGEKLASEDLVQLLCDQVGTPLPKGSTAIFQPVGALPSLPEWATIRFLHSGLRHSLGELLEVSDSRTLQQKLRPFGVVEYSLSALIRPVVAECRKQVQQHPDDEMSIRAETIEFLWRVFQHEGAETAFPSDTSVKLLSQAAVWASPAELHLGEGYGRMGAVTQDLFASWAKEKLVAEPAKLGLPASGEEAGSFLEWLGVARWPREVEAKHPDAAYLTEVKETLRYPVDFGDCRYETRDDLPWFWIEGAKTIDGLSEILTHADPEAILAWLILDLRSAGWSSRSAQHGKLLVRPPHKQYDRSHNGGIPSYTHWQISSSPWLPTAGGGMQEPRHCLIGDRQLEVLFPSPAQPDQALLERYGVSEGIGASFVRAGVMPGLAQLGRDDLYRLLLEAPELSPDGKASRALSRWFLSNEADLLGFAGDNRERFLGAGMLWGSEKKQSRFFPVSELRHVDQDGLPPSLLENLPIVDLPKRVGAQKVQHVLGIKPLGRAQIQQSLVSHRRSPNSEDRSAWFREAKPYIKKLRQAQSKQAQAVGAFERLELVLCDELLVRMDYEEAAYEHEADEGEWFVFSDLLYVRGDLDDSLDLLADATGVAIASVFGMAEGDAFAKILLCAPNSRGKLLKRMCGDDFHEEIEASKTKAQPTFAGPIVAPASVSPEEDRTTTETDDDKENGTGGEEPTPQGGDTPRTPGVSRVPHTPQPPVSPRLLVVRKVRRKVGKTTGRRKMVDGDKVEQMAVEFEQQCDPPRYPLEVGHITGQEAPGFDLVSFDSEADRAAFDAPETRDWTTVRRFIEVKGRSSSTAKIELKGNELRAARAHGDRYFLYRFFEIEDGEYEVAILENPMSAEEARSQIFEIDLERARATQRFEFVAETAAVASDPEQSDLVKP